MNYSDYDSDGYSSNEDADYVPSGEHFNLKLFLKRSSGNKRFWLVNSMLQQMNLSHNETNISPSND